MDTINGDGWTADTDRSFFTEYKGWRLHATHCRPGHGPEPNGKETLWQAVIHKDTFSLFVVFIPNASEAKRIAVAAVEYMEVDVKGGRISATAFEILFNVPEGISGGCEYQLSEMGNMLYIRETVNRCIRKVAQSGPAPAASQKGWIDNGVKG